MTVAMGAAELAEVSAGKVAEDAGGSCCLQAAGGSFLKKFGIGRVGSTYGRQERESTPCRPSPFGITRQRHSDGWPRKARGGWTAS